MLNLSEVVALLENLASGKGVYLAGATGPYFVKADGSILDKDGIQVAKASALGKKYYDDYAGNFPLTGIVPAAQLPLATNAVDSVESAKPVAYNEGDYFVKDGEAELYTVTSGAWVLVTDSALTEAATEPAEPAEGAYWLDTDDDGLFQYVTDAWVEFTTEAVVVAATAPTLYPVGYLLADEDTKKIYEREAADWDAGTSLAAGKLYTDGTDVYVFGSGSLAKI